MVSVGTILLTNPSLNFWPFSGWGTDFSKLIMKSFLSGMDYFWFENLELSKESFDSTR